MTDYTDYYRLSWSALAPPKPIIKLLSRLIIYTTIIGLVHLTYTSRLTKMFDPDASRIILVITALITLAFILFIHFMLNAISRHAGPKLIHYSVNQQGIFIGKHRYPHHSPPPLRFPDSLTQKKVLSAIDHYRSTSNP